MKVTCTVLGGLAIAAGLFTMTAQTALTDPVKIEARRAEFAKIQADLANQDPLQRLAVIQTIVESRDATKINFALKIALVSDDPAVRAIALRAYMATVGQIQFDIQSPPNIQRQLDAALSGDPALLGDLFRQYEYLGLLNGAQFKVVLTLKNYDMSRNTGATKVNGSDNNTFTVTGDRVAGRAEWVFNNDSCSYEFQPQRVLRDGPPVLRGSLQCTKGAMVIPRLTITAPMF